MHGAVPVAAQKPTPMIWAMLLASPGAFLVGAVLLSTGEYGGGALFLVAGAICLVRCTLALVRWRRSGRLAARPINRAYASSDVSWLPAKLLSGLTFQSGWVVIRPGWVAFLPSSGRTHLVGGMITAMMPVSSEALSTRVYDFASISARGPAAFDHVVWELATRDGLIVQATEGDVVRSKTHTTFRASDQTMILCDAPPEPLLAGWSRGQVRYDARAEAKVFAAITAVPAGIAVISGVIAHTARDPDIVWGVGFWVLLVVLGWVGFGVRYRRMTGASARR